MVRCRFRLVPLLVAMGYATGVSFAQAPSPELVTKPTSPVERAGQPGILVLASDDFTRPFLNRITDGFRDVTLTGPTPPVLYFESLDASRFERTGSLAELRDWLRRKYARHSIDLIVTIGDDALAFLAPNERSPWPGVPILFIESASIHVNTERDLPQVSGMLLEETLPGALRTMKAIRPQTRQVVMVQGASAIERVRFAGFPALIRAEGLEPIVVAGASIDEAAARVASLPADSVVLIFAPVVDARGRAVSQRSPCQVLSEASSVPAFTVGSQDLGCGVVGGLLREWQPVGQLLGARANALLGGAAPEIVHVPMAAFTTLAFDARQLTRWKIPERQLPPGSRVEFRPACLWRDLRAVILGGIVIGVIQTALIAGLLVERRRRQRTEVESRRQIAARAHLDRRAAMGELATSIAHELNQPLNAILQNAGVAQMLLKGDAHPDARGDLDEILEDIRKDDLRASEMIRHMRGMLHKGDVGQQAMDVNEVVRETLPFVRAEAASRNIELETQLTDRLAPVIGERVHVQQVLLNLLMNGMDAVTGMPPDRRRVSVRTCRTAEFVEVWVRDRGAGINPDHLTRIFDPFFTTKETGMGMGLAIARGIVEAHGGRLVAQNNPDGGATLAFSIPVDPGVTS